MAVAAASALKKIPHSLFTQPTVGPVGAATLADVYTLFIWSVAQGICSQSFPHDNSVKEVVAAANAAAATLVSTPEIANAGSELVTVLEQAA